MKSPEKDAGKIAGLTVARMKLSDLVPHPQNPRHHPEPGSPAWESLKKSLEHDFFDPLIVNVLDGQKQIISGHLRQKVLIASGFTQADCVLVKYDPPTALARLVAANRQTGEWDEAALADLLKGCKESLDGEAAALLGFTDLDLANMLRVSEGDKTGAEELNREAFSEFDHKCPRCQFEFDDKSD
jgi:ParB-like chromosome segregation protein Spo0J